MQIWQICMRLNIYPHSAGTCICLYAVVIIHMWYQSNNLSQYIIFCCFTAADLHQVIFECSQLTMNNQDYND